ncbi:MAG: hypothetical protein H0W14_00065 [Actinobacteria bacterium]|nr:hypothetical protein [Actinomycetota bacterium]
MPGPFRLADAASLERALEAAEFSDITIETMTVTPRFASPEEFARSSEAVCVPVRTLLADEGPESRARVWRAVADAAQAHIGPDGSVSLPSTVICVAGHRDDQLRNTPRG